MHKRVAVTGIGQINRSHMIAALTKSLSRPAVVLCQDDIAAKKLQEELKCFLGEAAPVLPPQATSDPATIAVARIRLSALFFIR